MIQVYKMSIATTDTKQVGLHLLVKFMACWNSILHEHLYLSIDSSQYQALSDDWLCGKIGYVRTGQMIGKDPSEIALRRHHHEGVHDTMYSTQIEEGKNLGFQDLGVAWFAWKAP